MAIDNNHITKLGELKQLIDGLWGKVTTAISNAVSGLYTKPSGGIPKSDLASGVQTSLDKADTALQSFTETDPVFAASPAAGITEKDITDWNDIKGIFKCDFSTTFSKIHNALNKGLLPVLVYSDTYRNRQTTLYVPLTHVRCDVNGFDASYRFSLVHVNTYAIESETALLTDWYITRDSNGFEQIPDKPVEKLVEVIEGETLFNACRNMIIFGYIPYVVEYTSDGEIKYLEQCETSTKIEFTYISGDGQVKSIILHDDNTWEHKTYTFVDGNGLGATGTWGINISGNAATADNATKATQTVRWLSSTVAYNLSKVPEFPFGTIFFNSSSSQALGVSIKNDTSQSVTLYKFNKTNNSYTSEPIAAGDTTKTTVTTRKIGGMLVIGKSAAGNPHVIYET